MITIFLVGVLCLTVGFLAGLSVGALATMKTIVELMEEEK